ncbi:ribonuclease 3 precursor, putative [Entamoeba invadens IP1]|uniref:Ribonuclease 3, putative n=1 Tax=Entamoeba invadens IP1 TaxID=370355 RepID=L7FM79_ENTIV|nr:ribonuclease 3 precursor, putative [Entamoeba invadens IP1]ELP90974.1 ribonuclease 3 precursor, putative [Entamoeba invadens IP1]|eukprot:XP_004257745.1 ribonuclease 3 precursor, putative [Entamoeba invadens IP1]
MIVFLFLLVCFSFEQPEEPKESKIPPSKGLSEEQIPTTSTVTTKRAQDSEKVDPQKEVQKEKPESSQEEEKATGAMAQVVRRKTPQLKEPTEFPKELTTSGRTLKILTNYRMCKYYQKKTSRMQFLLFVLFWPGEKCYDIECSLPVKTTNFRENFLLHGLWPQKSGAKHFECCSSFYKINDVEKRIMEDDILVQRIADNWMSIDMCRFATYQLDKHGSCAMKTYTGKNGPMQYINVAIDLYQKMDLWQLLKESRLKVETDKLYHIEELREVMREIFGVKPAFLCRRMNSIHEVKICYDIQINKFEPNPIECPDRIFQYEKKKCEKMVKFEKFPEYLLNHETAPRNNCPF